MARFDRAIALAKRLISKNGEIVTLRTYAQGDSESDSPWKRAENIPDDQPIEAVFLDYERTYIDGQAIKQGDQMVLMPSEGLTEAPVEDSIVIRGEDQNWKVVSVKPLNPNGQVIMYELQVRQ